jgi:hypothetical protein
VLLQSFGAWPLRAPSSAEKGNGKYLFGRAAAPFNTVPVRDLHYRLWFPLLFHPAFAQSHPTICHQMHQNMHQISIKK